MTEALRRHVRSCGGSGGVLAVQAGSMTGVADCGSERFSLLLSGTSLKLVLWA